MGRRSGEGESAGTKRRWRPGSANGLGSYNGFTGDERIRKLQEMHRLFPGKSHPYYRGECHLCGDPRSPVAPHDEDYSEPYLWTAPAVRALCGWCHRRIHQRFTHPYAWKAYIRHVRRGGYGSDLNRVEVAREVATLTKAISNGEVVALPSLRESSPQDRWWERLAMTQPPVNGASARRR